MKSKWVEEVNSYNGEQLHSLFAYLNHGLMGDSIVAWRGPCDIPFEHMVDGEDLLAEATIAGSDMVHFIIEKFNCQLLGAVVLQRLLATIVKDYVQDGLLRSGDMSQMVRREGDDVYINDGKLSISIATQSPTSSLIHFAVNVSNKGTPVQTSSLQELSVEAKTFAEDIMQRFCREVTGVVEATEKVKWVR